MTTSCHCHPLSQASMTDPYGHAAVQEWKVSCVTWACHLIPLCLGFPMC